MELRKMRKTFSMGDLHPSSKNTRSYTLDKEKALQKKSEACKRQHLMYELKSGKNFVVEMSTGAYEIIKKEIHEILYNSEECKSYSVVQKQDGVENAGLTVDSCYRVYNKKQNGQVGTMLKFTINLYHTSCSMNVNGKRVDLFINDIFDGLCEKVKKEYNEIELLNQSIESYLSQMKNYTSKVIQKSITNKEIHPENDQADQFKDMNNSQTKNFNRQILDTQYIESDKNICPGCRKYVDDGIGCDRCDFWYHYECENIASNIGNEALKHIEYICRFCNDDMLYENRNHLECDANEESNIIAALQTSK
ncbi:Hypothetical predicted protein [Mytilus galloprovincialis]|uniref:Zinc finger PHD-type domain-containing protein n=1 Tax=Mytilus galloprovincialis TaxID=29158 RepID=A0A8B6GLU7_MYTGA|nr:Hypothetical predicted protein [Mytilus galloprovincialis]